MMKNVRMMAAVMIMICAFTLSGCGERAADPGTPPPEVINPNLSEAGSGPSEQEGTAAAAGEAAYGDGEVLEDAVSIRIGRDGTTEYAVNMYQNQAVNTMLDYLTDSALLFPTYTYSEEDGFVGQRVRGNYTRDEEVSVTDIKAGELYLFGDGQLRLYFKDVPEANITATPVGYAADAAEVSEAVPAAYEANQGDTWGVDVYFWLTKNI